MGIAVIAAYAQVVSYGMSYINHPGSAVNGSLSMEVFGKKGEAV